MQPLSNLMKILKCLKLLRWELLKAGFINLPTSSIKDVFPTILIHLLKDSKGKLRLQNLQKKIPLLID